MILTNTRAEIANILISTLRIVERVVILTALVLICELPVSFWLYCKNLVWQVRKNSWIESAEIILIHILLNFLKSLSVKKINLKCLSHLSIQVNNKCCWRQLNLACSCKPGFPVENTGYTPRYYLGAILDSRLSRRVASHLDISSLLFHSLMDFVHISTQHSLSEFISMTMMIKARGQGQRSKWAILVNFITCT